MLPDMADSRFLVCPSPDGPWETINQHLVLHDRSRTDRKARATVAMIDHQRSARP